MDGISWPSVRSVFRAGEPVTEEECESHISKAFYQAGIPLDASDLSAKASLMNISLPKRFRHLRPCQALRNQLRIAHDNDLDLQVNFAPAGSFVDIHIGVSNPLLRASVADSKQTRADTVCPSL